jgi:hypothetical protein
MVQVKLNMNENILLLLESIASRIGVSVESVIEHAIALEKMYDYETSCNHRMLLDSQGTVREFTMPYKGQKVTDE